MNIMSKEVSSHGLLLGNEPEASMKATHNERSFTLIVETAHTTRKAKFRKAKICWLGNQRRIIQNDGTQAM